MKISMHLGKSFLLIIFLCLLTAPYSQVKLEDFKFKAILFIPLKNCFYFTGFRHSEGGPLVGLLRILRSQYPRFSREEEHFIHGGYFVLRSSHGQSCRSSTSFCFHNFISSILNYNCYSLQSPYESYGRLFFGQ